MQTYTQYFYSNGDIEQKEGINLKLPCAPSSILLVVEYNSGSIVNCYNPNDL